MEFMKEPIWKTWSDRHARLNADDIESALKAVPKWRQRGSAIVRGYAFSDILHALDFANQVRLIALELKHDPDVLISNAKVKLELSTHDVGGLTVKDFETAARIDQIVN